MSKEFTDIKIVEMDDAASRPSGEGALIRIVLKLSQDTPPAWSQYFNHAWSQHIYMMKRRASVAGDRLDIVCVPGELQSDHIPELNKIIAETNEAYRKFAVAKMREREVEAENERRRKEELSDLKRNLKFD